MNADRSGIIDDDELNAKAEIWLETRESKCLEQWPQITALDFLPRISRLVELSREISEKKTSFLFVVHEISFKIQIDPSFEFPLPKDLLSAVKHAFPYSLFVLAVGRRRHKAESPRIGNNIHPGPVV